MRIQDTWDSLRKSWSARPAVADVAAFDTIEQALGQRLPANYKGFLMESNGGETLKPLPYLRFYGLEELLTRRVDTQPPDLLEIATNESAGLRSILRSTGTARTILS